MVVMSPALPDELWTKIIEQGVKKSGFNYKDLCSLSISSRRLRRLSSDESFWSHLLSSDFPSPSSSSSLPNSSSKSLYKIRFERERQKRILAHKRAVLRKESEVAEKTRKLREIECRLDEELEKMRDSLNELSNLNKVRQASVALNVWQPEVVRGRQKQVVEQCVVPLESRVLALEMELKLCKKQIAGCEKAYKDEIRRLEKIKEELTSLKYHPLRGYTYASSAVEERSTKRKRLKGRMNSEDVRPTSPLP